jgi:hypothetical protein
MFDSDLLYLATHPLAAAIHTRVGQLRDQADSLPKGSAERQALEKRIAVLEEYDLPKPKPEEQRWVPMMVGGRAIGQMRGLRARHRDTKVGRPAGRRIAARAALEDKCDNPKLTWRQLAERHGFQAVTRRREDGRFQTLSGAHDLARAVRRFKAVLRQEGILLPSATGHA